MGDTEKRLIIFLILSVAIVFFFTTINPPPVPPPPPPTSPTTVPVPPGLGPGEPFTPPSSIIPAEQETQRPAQLVTIETPLYRATVTSEGAVLTHWELKHYMETANGSDPVVLYPPVDFEPLQPPLALRLTGTADDPLSRTVYHLEGSDSRLSSDRPSARLRFTAEVPHPSDATRTVRVTKELLFHFDTYRIDLITQVTGIDTPYQLTLGDSFGIHQGKEQWQQRFIGHRGAVTLVNGEMALDAPDDLPATPVTHSGDVRWTALEGKYFIAALIPKMPIGESIVEKLGEFGSTAGLVLPPGQRHEIALYAGPKEYKRLKSLQSGLEQTIDFGWFWFGSWAVVKMIAKPLFLVLQFIYGYAHNFGVAIIVTTVMIKILFIPLTHKSYTSMKAMQALQPKMAELQKKHKDDKEKYNREVFTLYKTHKVNPLGGCLPIFLQLPVFVAFFNILYTTIELRHAPLILWIRDLSSPDPFYVLPIIMGLTMFIQQKIQPTAMDPRQAKIMLMLPIVFTFFFLTFPSGLVLYWLFNNLLTIAQQYVTIHLLSSTKPAPVK